MRVDKSQSHGSPEFLTFAEALVNLIKLEHDHPTMSEKDALEFACRTIWPGCNIYRGGTHWRVMPSPSLRSAKSFYVDFSAASPKRIERSRPQWEGNAA